MTSHTIPDWESHTAENKDNNLLQFCLDNFMTQFVVNPTRGSNILDIVLSTDEEIIKNVDIKPPLANSDHNMVQFNLMTEGICTQKKLYKI